MVALRHLSRFRQADELPILSSGPQTINHLLHGYNDNPTLMHDTIICVNPLNPGRPEIHDNNPGLSLNYLQLWNTSVLDWPVYRPIEFQW